MQSSSDHRSVLAILRTGKTTTQEFISNSRAVGIPVQVAAFGTGRVKVPREGSIAISGVVFVRTTLEGSRRMIARSRLCDVTVTPVSSSVV